MLKSHRDYKCVNKANAAVRGCIYSKLGLSSIDRVKKMIEDSSLLSYQDNQRILELLDVARNTNLKCLSYLLQSQDEISVTVCDNYASQQFNSLQKCEKFSESYKEIQSISNFIVTEDMNKLNKIIVWGNQSGKSNV